MIWPFKRKQHRKSPRPVMEDAREWNEDWQVGDLAECIDDSWSYPWQFDPKQGDILRVAAVIEAVGMGNVLGYYLKFEGLPEHCGWICTGFKKLRPTIEPASEKFTASIKRLGQIKKADRQPERVS